MESRLLVVNIEWWEKEKENQSKYHASPAQTNSTDRLSLYHDSRLCVHKRSKLCSFYWNWTTNIGV